MYIYIYPILPYVRACTDVCFVFLVPSGQKSGMLCPVPAAKREWHSFTVPLMGCATDGLLRQLISFMPLMGFATDGLLPLMGHCH